ncbi:putative DNA binding protein [Hibiscus syriacus]|uniref:DNA binding protein n=2 Tax=Hibiscus syriacus TaxID=106335 RepID=A0A6A3B0W7_HIBSY|nr:putative DNA binding protein [Hibiscus syriacus]
MDFVKGKVQKLRNLFESGKSSLSSSNLLSPKEPASKPVLRPTKSMISSGFINPSIRLPGTKDRIVVYLTSFQGIRRTFEDCYAVMMIFRGFKLWVDERDISMDVAYKKELQSILKVKNVTLPQVFIKGKYIGDADVIKNMFEMGELAKILDDFPRRKPGLACNACGDVRFMPCENCSSSRKLFDDDEGLF